MEIGSGREKGTFGSHKDRTFGSGIETTSENRVRLNKFLAEAGISSRRACDRLIEEGRITVNGKKVYELGSKVDPKTDKVLVDGKPLRKNVHGKVVAIMNKPKGVLTTMEDPLGRPTIKDYLQDLPVRLFPVGRLDWDSEGLLLLTNDGDYAQRVAHPKSEVTKTYIVKLDGSPTPEELAKLKSGVSIIGGRVKALAVSRFPKGDSKKYSWVKIVINEGKNRQIRLMFEKIGYDVLKLQRVAIGRLRLGSLERGQIVFLNEVAAERVFHQFLDENGERPAAEEPAEERATTTRQGHGPRDASYRSSGRSTSSARYHKGVKREESFSSDKRARPQRRPKSHKRDQPTGKLDFDAFD